MAVVQLDLPPDLEQFAQAQAKTEGYANLDAYLLEVLRKLKVAKTKDDLEAKLRLGLDQLGRGEGRTISAQEWKDLRHDFCQRHSIQDET